MKRRNFINTLIFHLTKKPECYKRIDNPPKTVLQKLLHPQRARQQQYNNWCKKNGVYNGSYLPENPDLLLSKGWNETTNPKNKTGNIRDFQRKSSKQLVRYDAKKQRKGRQEDEHYHWYNATSVQEARKTPNKRKYIDRYGKVCADKSPESHLAPKDKNYIYRK